MSRCSICGYPLDKRDEPFEVCEDCYNAQIKIVGQRVPCGLRKNQRKK